MPPFRGVHCGQHQLASVRICLRVAVVEIEASCTNNTTQWAGPRFCPAWRTTPRGWADPAGSIVCSARYPTRQSNTGWSKYSFSTRQPAEVRRGNPDGRTLTRGFPCWGAHMLDPFHLQRVADVSSPRRMPRYTVYAHLRGRCRRVRALTERRVRLY